MCDSGFFWVIYDETLAIFLEKLVYVHREYSSEVPPVDSVSPVNLEAPPVLSSNLTDSNSMIVERGESETSKGCSAVELYLEHQKNIVNASGWNEYIISITNPNEEDIQKTIYLDGTRYNWDDTEGWVPDSGFKGKTVATLANMTVHPGDTVQITVPMQLKATGERNFYIFKVRSEEG